MQGFALKLALISIFSCEIVRAQSPPYVAPAYAPPPLAYPPGLHLFPIVVEGEPHDLKITLSTEENGKPFLYCVGRCNAYAYAGDYWLSVRSSRETLPGKKEIRLKHSSVIHVRGQPRDADSAVGIVGVSLLGGGIGLVGLGLSYHDDDENQGGSMVLMGLASIVAGVVLVIVSSAQNHDEKKPEVSIEP
jgi:hypothetical protein